MSNIWTEESVQKWIDDAGYDAKVLGIIRYKVGKQLRTDIGVTCVECSEPFRRNWYNYRREGDGKCPICAQKRRTQTLRDVFYSRNNLLELCPQIADIWDPENEHPPEYYGLNSNERAKFICKYCGKHRHTHIVSVSNALLKGLTGCLKCDNHYSRTEEEFVKELSIVQPTIKLAGGYKGTGTVCSFYCMVCNSVWPKRPINLLCSSSSRPQEGCPVCSGSMIGSAPVYLNSIWDNPDARRVWEKYVDEDFMKSHTPSSGQRVQIPCPDCGEIKHTTVTAVTRRGDLCCKCGDTNSYPNKFVFHILKQLHIQTQCEWIPQWGKDIRYDDYLLKYNIIIENHGLQHYEEVGFGRTLAEEQENDRIKYEKAMTHNIDEYIVLDCRKSEVDWIKRSIMTSKLPQIFGFTEEDIDWFAADKYATKNIIKQMCVEWENGLTIADASLKYGVSEGTIREWLKKGAKFGWCGYDPKWRYRKVYCFQLDKTFPSINDAAKETGICQSDITQCCHRKQGYAGFHPETGEKLIWCFLEEKDTYIPKENLSMTKTICIETMQVYQSFVEACDAVGGKCPQDIAFACDGINKTAYGFHWSRLDELTDEKIEQAKLDRVKPAYLYVYCLDTKTIYPSIVNAQTTTGDWHIYDFIMGARKYAGKSRHTYYAVYNQKKKDGTTIPGAITLGLLTEDEFLNKLNTQQNN